MIDPTMPARRAVVYLLPPTRSAVGIDSMEGGERQVSDPVTTALDSATTNLQTELLAAGGAAVGIGAVVFALRKGWKFFRSMI